MSEGGARQVFLERVAVAGQLVTLAKAFLRSPDRPEPIVIDDGMVKRLGQ